ncbi:efflux RND transporter permease subunit [Halalkalibaculum sp. DA3122]|uniref:efflux RND transporter permease subunit n=1 Tax=Halalkalibaculum sp. DA3122 TaxID=3373607 RepID=UPI00375449DC
MIKRFIERPVLSTVISIIIVILGFLGYNALPVSLYPEIAPPTIQVTATYPGANAETVLNSVVAPLEEQINGVEGMTYMSSTASNNGRAQIQVFFDLGTDPDIAAVNVQNRVAQASNMLPQEVTQTGVTTQKQQTSRLLIFTLYSPDGTHDGTFIENYARINLIPRLQRVNGVGTADAFGANTYSMRIWMKPDVMASYDLVPNDVIRALNEQSFVAAPGAIGENSGQAFQYTMKYKGRFSTAEEYEDIIIREGGQNAEMLRLGEVADVELGAQTYSVHSTANGGPSVGMFVSKTAGANAQEVVENVKAEIEQASESFPEGMEYTTVFDANSFLTASINKVFVTFLEAFLLVFIVVFVFLQDWRSTLIPAIAVPVSIIGTFFFLNLFGYSVNLLTLFALVLAIGIVVDDAIIVVEIIHAKLEEGAESGMKAAVDGMDEIAGAIVSITLVMSAIFVPVTFITGSTGVFFQQFGITLATAIIISAVNALTLSPALCALVLKPEHKHIGENKTFVDRFAIAFNAAFEAGKYRYKQVLGFFTRNSWAAVATVGGAIALFAVLFQTTPTGFVPDEDQGTFFANVSLPPSSSLERTREVLARVDDILADMEVVDSRLAISGFGIISGSGSQYGFIVGKLKHWEERDQSVNDVITELQQRTSHINEADIAFFSPPVISGFGNTSGFTVNVQDMTSGELAELEQATQKVQEALFQRPEIQYANSYFQTDYPQYMVNVDVAKAQRAGFTVQSIMDVMQAYYGGLYVSNFTRFGKLYRVYVQAEPEARGSRESLQNISVRNAQGAMAPISSFVDLERVYGPQNVSRFNLFTSVELTGATNPGYSSGDAINAIEEVFDEQISGEYGYEFSGLTREENQSSGQELIIFALCLIFVYFLLSAQYESYLVPWAVILPLPIGLAGSFIFANIFGIANNIYLQISAIMLMGLLAKNAILVVEFALQRRRNQGMSIVKAAIDGAEARLRPILMTSFAFIAGLLPLALATGINANANQSIGIGTAGGMFIGTFIGLLVVPVLFIIFQKLQERISGPPEIVRKRREQIMSP